MSRYTQKSQDANHNSIVATFQAHGASVVDLSHAGEDVPDLYVERGDWCGLVEVKDGSKEPARRRLRSGQLDLACRVRIYLVECPEDALAVLKGERAPIKGIPKAFQKKGDVYGKTWEGS